MARGHRDQPASPDATPGTLVPLYPPRSSFQLDTEEQETPDPSASARALVLGLALILWPLAVVVLYARMLLVELGLVP
jgi:hypothetical protein